VERREKGDGRWKRGAQSEKKMEERRWKREEGRDSREQPEPINNQ
jgi:hypothetical protein